MQSCASQAASPEAPDARASIPQFSSRDCFPVLHFSFGCCLLCPEIFICASAIPLQDTDKILAISACPVLRNVPGERVLLK